MTEFIQELHRLKTVLKDDGIVLKCLQLLEAIGKYILQKKAQTHPDSIRLLQSIYRDLEILLLSKGVSETARRNILADEIAQFKKLKEKLTEPVKSASGDYFRNADKPFGYSVPVRQNRRRRASPCRNTKRCRPMKHFFMPSKK